MNVCICPLCEYQNSPEAMQGALGNKVQFRCRMCGAWWAAPADVYEASLEGCSDDE